MTATPDVIAAALSQVDLGFAAFALASNAKVPVTQHGFKNATTNPEWVRTQLEQASAGNYGIVWPEDSAEAVVVFDLDDGSDGRERPWQDRLLELIKVHGPLPRTKATTTPSGGRHAFFRWPADVPIPPGDELFGFTVRWPGRGYLVGPGSSIDGRPYIAGDERHIADLPEAWVKAALEHHPARRRSVAGDVITITGGFVLPDVIPAGRRYATVRDYIASRYNAGLSADELWELVRTQVAPRFTSPKTDAELRGDFDRAIAKIGERLGPPAAAARIAPEDAVAAVSPIEVRNLADIPVEAVTWLWHRYLPVGAITLFDGNPGEGKSTIVADVIARLTQGSTWPDGTHVGPPGRVLYITKEDDAATQVRPRIEAAGGDPRLVDFVAADLLFPRDTGRFQELLEATRPRLVLLDPLMSYLEGKVKVISDNEIRSAIMTPLAYAARSVSCAVTVIRHFNKGSGQTALQRGAGSLGGLAGAARMVLALTGDPEDEDERARVFGVVKSSFEAKPPSLKAVIESAPVEGFQMTVSRVAWRGPSDTSVIDLMERSRDEHQLVLAAEDALREILTGRAEPVAAAEIHAAMGARRHSRNAVYHAAKALKVVVDRRGFPAKTFWALPRPLIDFDSRPSHSDSETTDGFASRPSHPWGETTETTDSRPAETQSYETPTTGTTETTGHQPQSSLPSLSSQGASPSAGARAHAREDDRPRLTVVPDTGLTTAGWCHFPVDHQTKHRDVNGDPWCEICTPREVKRR